MKIPDNFCGLEPEFSNYGKSKVIILPVPFDKTRTWIVGKDWNKLDTSKGPKAIIIASKNMELYDIELDKTIADVGIHTLPELDCSGKPLDVIERIKTETAKHLEKNKFIVMLGGEHSITAGIVKSYKEKYSDLSVLQIDAHSDLREKFDEAGKESHASLMARVHEMGVPSVQVGIRSMSEEEAELVKKEKLNIFYAKDIVGNDKWFDKAISKLSDNVFITFDLDAFDPSIMSATGTPVPGGIKWYPILRFLKKVFEKKNVVGFDVVELAPNGDVSCDFLAAKLVYKMLGYKFNGTK